jgi:SAM-dependent methyltransferase
MPEFSSTYDALAARWDGWSAAIVPDVREEWAGKVHAHLAPGERVVELGCGTGVPVGQLLAATYTYTGIDASPGMLANAAVALPDVDLVLADMHALQFPPGSLGAVVAFSSISHTPRLQHASLFAAIASWLRPGGVLIGNLHSHDDPDDFEANWLGAGPMSWSGFDGATNIALLEAAGLPVIESAVVEQVEPAPERCVIRPLWFVARRSETDDS